MGALEEKDFDVRRHHHQQQQQQQQQQQHCDVVAPSRLHLLGLGCARKYTHTHTHSHTLTLSHTHSRTLSHISTHSHAQVCTRILHDALLIMNHGRFLKKTKCAQYLLSHCREDTQYIRHTIRISIHHLLTLLSYLSHFHSI